MSNDPADRHSIPETRENIHDASPDARGRAGRAFLVGGIIGALLGLVIALPIGMLGMATPTGSASITNAVFIAAIWAIGGLIVGAVIGVGATALLAGRSKAPPTTERSTNRPVQQDWQERDRPPV